MSRHKSVGRRGIRVLFTEHGGEEGGGRMGS